MITHISTVAVYVENQDHAEYLWTEKVGFEVKEQMGPNAFWLEVGPKDQPTNLVIYPKSMMKNWWELKPSAIRITRRAESCRSRGSPEHC